MSRNCCGWWLVFKMTGGEEKIEGMIFQTKRRPKGTLQFGWGQAVAYFKRS